MTLPEPHAAFRWSDETWGPALRCRPLEVVAQHLFTSRQLQLPSEPGWSALAASAGVSIDAVMRVKQVHGNSVRVLSRGTVSSTASTERPDGDALVANVPGLALAVMVADCVPIVIADARIGAAAAVHAGWRGTCARVVQAAIAAMQREFGSDPAELVAAIGPSAGPADYEVGSQLADAFLDAGHSRDDVARWFIPTQPKPHLDLWAANRDQMVAAGVPARRISTCGLSTVSHPDVFDSYRVDGERAGRMAAVIVVPRAA